MKRERLFDSLSSLVIVVVTWFLTDYLMTNFFADKGNMFDMVLYLLICFVLFGIKVAIKNLINKKGHSGRR